MAFDVAQFFQQQGIGIQPDPIEGVGIERDPIPDVGINNQAEINPKSVSPEAEYEDELKRQMEETEESFSSVAEEQVMHDTKPEAEQPSGFMNILEKVGMVVAGAAALKGDTKPLELLLAAKIGKNKAIELEKQEARQAAKLKSENYKNRLDIIKKEIDIAKSQQGEWIPVVTGNGAWMLDKRTGETKVIAETSGKSKSSTTEEVHIGRDALGIVTKTIKRKTVDEGGNETITVEPRIIGVSNPKKFLDGGNYEINHTVKLDSSTGRTYIDPVMQITPKGTRAQARENLKLGIDQFEVGKRSFLEHEPLKNASERMGRMKAIQGFMENIMETGKLGTSSIGIINQFQQMIDEATVREGDVDLILNTMSKFKNLANRAQRTTEDQLIPESLVRDLVLSARALAEAQSSERIELASGVIKGLEGVVDKSTISRLKNFAKKNYMRNVSFDEDIYDPKTSPPKAVRAGKDIYREEGATNEGIEKMKGLIDQYPDSAYLLDLFEQMINEMKNTDYINDNE